jgi:hypothetical protein
MENKTDVKINFYYKLFASELSGTTLTFGTYRINESPQTVLSELFPEHYLQSYLGNRPWLIEVNSNRGYLVIDQASQVQDQKIVKLSLESFIGEASLAKRKEGLKEETRILLRDCILQDLDPENTMPGLFSRENHNSALAYSHILPLLGHQITIEQIKDMREKQRENMQSEEMKDRVRRAYDESGRDAFRFHN